MSLNTGGPVSAGNVSLVPKPDNVSGAIQINGIDVIGFNQSGIVGGLAGVQQGYPIAGSVLNDALTITLNQCNIQFRNSLMSSGELTTVSVASPISMIIPNGATLGSSNGSLSILAVIAIYTGTQVELGVVRLSSQLQMNVILDETLITTDTINVTSDSSDVVYSSVARTNVPYKLLGTIDITEATAGQWATAPSAIRSASTINPYVQINPIIVNYINDNKPPSGLVSFFANINAPTGWLKCNGAAVSRTTYSNLFVAIGTTYGVGDGSTTFNLPDLRGEFIRGWDDSRGIDAGRALGVWQADSLKSHTHTVTIPAWNGVGGPTPNLDANQGGYNYTYTSSAVGGTETRPRNVALLACIKI